MRTRLPGHDTLTDWTSLCIDRCRGTWDDPKCSDNRTMRMHDRGTNLESPILETHALRAIQSPSIGECKITATAPHGFARSSLITWNCGGEFSISSLQNNMLGLVLDPA